MRFICDSYEIHMRVIYALFIYIYIYIQKRKNTRSAWKWTELPPRIWPRCNTMQHHATKIKAEFVEQKSDAGLVDRTASFMTRLAPWWVFAVAILRNFIIHKIFRTHIYIYIYIIYVYFNMLQTWWLQVSGSWTISTHSQVDQVVQLFKTWHVYQSPQRLCSDSTVAKEDAPWTVQLAASCIHLSSGAWGVQYSISIHPWNLDITW